MDENLIEKINNSSILSSQEKSEWIFLLPKMKSEQKEELEKLLSINIPTKQLKNERTKEPKTASPVPSFFRSSVPPSLHQDIKPAAAPSDVESLKFLTIEMMRKAPSVYLFLEELGKKMKEIVASRRASGEAVRAAFEQSPLHRSYVSAGLKLMAGQESNILSHAEFEALADFRSTIRKTLA